MNSPLNSYVHRFEPGTDPAAPPLLLLHGTGGNENDLIPLARQLSPGSALLSPRGQVSEHGALRFFRRLAEGVFDPEEIKQRTHELADFIATAAEHYGFNRSRLLAVGFSNGANVASSLLLLRPESLAGAALLRPMIVLPTPAKLPALGGKRVLISAGDLDPIVPAEHPGKLAALLRRAGAAVTLHAQPASHQLIRDDFVAVQEFVAAAKPR